MPTGALSRTAATGRRAARARGRRRILLLLLALAALGAAATAVHQAMPSWYARLWHPLHYEDAVRVEAERNGLDPALVAAVIDVESGFVPDSRSHRGAVGLMQVLPETARFVASRPGRPSPSPERIGEAEVNIAYGSAYLAYLVERHGGDLPLALAAYNAGESRLAAWRAEARDRGTVLRVPEDLPFAETRAYVRDVLRERGIYRRAYGDRLGPPPG